MTDRTPAPPSATSGAVPAPPPSGLGPRLRVAHLDGRAPTAFDVTPSPEQRAALAAWLDIIAIDALRLTGQIAPAGSSDWLLTADLTARVVQPCIITLAPVRSKLAEAVRRRYTPDLTEPEGDEVEMPEDDTLEPLTANIDLGAVLIEALELALPLYPRVEGAALDAPAEAEPADQPERKPFAGLADLMARKDKPGAS